MRGLCLDYVKDDGAAIHEADHARCHVARQMKNIEERLRVRTLDANPPECVQLSVGATENGLSLGGLRNLLGLAGFEVVRDWHEVLLPQLLVLVNRYFGKVWPFSTLALANFGVTRPAPTAAAEPRVFLIIPARNEAGTSKRSFAACRKWAPAPRSCWWRALGRRYPPLFGAAMLGLTIVEMPVRYQTRRYGQTNTQRWPHGLILLRRK